MIHEAYPGCNPAVRSVMIKSHGGKEKLCGEDKMMNIASNNVGSLRLSFPRMIE